MHRGRKTQRKAEINVTSPLPICQTCPFKDWCSKLNFRTRGPEGEVKVCPVWWVVMEKMREKGILKATPPLSPLPLTREEARTLLDKARQKRMQRLAG